MRTPKTRPDWPGLPADCETLGLPWLFLSLTVIPPADLAVVVLVVVVVVEVVEEVEVNSWQVASLVIMLYWSPSHTTASSPQGLYSSWIFWSS